MIALINLESFVTFFFWVKEPTHERSQLQCKYVTRVLRFDMIGVTSFGVMRSISDCDDGQ